MLLPHIILKKGKEASIQRKHPWVFSGAIHSISLEEDQKSPSEGDLVEVYDFNHQYIGIGYFGEESIAVRMLSLEQVEIDLDFWITKLRKAKRLRQELHLQAQETNCFRLVHGEGDDCPGLIIDIYNDIAILQAHSLGIYKMQSLIAEALKIVFGGELSGIYSKSDQTLPKQYEVQDGYLYQEGEVNAPSIVIENGLNFEVNWVTGQKTGFFIDQRENRKLLQQYVQGKKVLNTFCYSGGFSIYSIAAGAKEVVSVDASAKAIELLNQNLTLNFKRNNHSSHVGDTLHFLKDNAQKYDVIILDPPAYAKSIKSKHKAVQGYRRLNEMGFKSLNKGGILFTFSCSQVIHRKLFEDTVTAAAISSGRNIKILHHLSQASDHPVNIFHPEGSYLKGLVLYVE